MLKANKIYFHRAMSIHKSRPVFWGWYVVFSSFIMLTLIYGARYFFLNAMACSRTVSLLPLNQSNAHSPVGTVEKPSQKPILADPRFWLLVACNKFRTTDVS